MGAQLGIQQADRQHLRQTNIYIPTVDTDFVSDIYMPIMLQARNHVMKPGMIWATVNLPTRM